MSDLPRTGTAPNGANPDHPTELTPQDLEKATGGAARGFEDIVFVPRKDPGDSVQQTVNEPSVTGSIRSPGR